MLRRAMGDGPAAAQVDVLLKELENAEERAPEAERFDVGRLRVELQLDR